MGSTSTQVHDETPMLLSVLAVILTAGLYVIAVRVREHGGPIPAQLGWMSDQWLAEYRASQVS